MSRQLDPSLASALSDGIIYPIVLVMLTFASSTKYVWSGVGNFVYNGNTYLGVGSLGSISTISEGSEVQADGINLKLSGIDPVFMGECMADIQLGAPAKVWFALVSEGAIIGSPYLIFSGNVDQPKFNTSADECSITLSLENELVNLQRASQRRYTSADQRNFYPNDTAFGWVEQLNDQALVWGT